MAYVDPSEAPESRVSTSAVETEVHSRGIPGTGEYEYRVVGGRYRKFLGRNDADLAVQPIGQLNDLFSSPIDGMRKTAENELFLKLVNEAKAQGLDVDDATVKASIAKQVESVTTSEMQEIAPLFRTLIDHQRDIYMVTSELPRSLADRENVGGANHYFLVEKGTKASNYADIFGHLVRLGARVTDIYARPDPFAPHGENEFFGWRVSINGVEYVFILNSNEHVEEQSVPIEIPEDPARTAPDNDNGAPIAPDVAKAA